MYAETRHGLNNSLSSSTNNAMMFEEPFGDVSCEREAEVLKSKYKDFYYSQGPFNDRILDPQMVCQSVSKTEIEIITSSY